jgi:hypothetical protein
MAHTLPQEEQGDLHEDACSDGIDLDDVEHPSCLTEAALVIKRAEDALGPLSKGQKVDLLLDNLPELEGCADATAIVERLEREKNGGRA